MSLHLKLVYHNKKALLKECTLRKMHMQYFVCLKDKVHVKKEFDLAPNGLCRQRHYAENECIFNFIG